jgi:flagellar protein FlaG
MPANAPSVNPVIPTSTAPAATQATSAPAKASTADLTSAAKAITNFLSSSNTNIQFSLDQSSGEMVVKIEDAATGKTIRQIPNEVVLRIAQELKQNKSLGNLALDEKA